MTAYRATLADGTHFRFTASHPHRVSFDQTDRERVWGIYPAPSGLGTGRDVAEYLARDTAPAGPASEVTELSIIPST